jgi:hypothetical protein
MPSAEAPRKDVDVAWEALFGFGGVVLGSLTTAGLTIYKETVTGRRETAGHDRQYERDRKAARDAFQRDSIIALQDAVTALIEAAYSELDRMLAVYRETNQWPARLWETPTATGWSNAVLKLETSRARVFDDELRSLATELRTLAGDSVWATSLESAEETSRRLEQQQIQFHAAVARALPSLY